MGEENSKPSQEQNIDLSNLLQRYKLVQDLIDPRFSHLQIYQQIENTQTYHSEPPLLMVKEFRIELSRTQEWDHQFSKLNSRTRIQHKNLTQMVTFSNSVSREWCSEYFKYLVVMEYSETSLEQELKDRYLIQDQSMKFFSEPELWYIMSGLTQALALLLEYGIQHGDVQPANILITGDGSVKLCDLLCYYSDQQGYKRMLANSSYRAILSPELIQSVQKMDSNPPVSWERSDMYSLGITILCCATNLNFRTFFDFDKYTIRRDLINQRLNELRSRQYSSMLIGCIQKLLNESPHLRPTAVELSNYISQNCDQGTSTYQDPNQLGKSQQQSFLY